MALHLLFVRFSSNVQFSAIAAKSSIEDEKYIDTLNFFFFVIKIAHTSRQRNNKALSIRAFDSGFVLRGMSIV